MKIINVTVTKVAEKSTVNADYLLEYSIADGELTRVYATIRKKNTDAPENALQVGNIYLEQGTVSCNIPETQILGPLFEDFDTIVGEIRNSINKTS